MEFKISKAKTIALILGALTFVIIGVFLTGNEELKARIAGWLAIIFFGGCFLMGCAQLFHGGVVLRIDEHGIHHNPLPFGFGTIPWDSISALYCHSYKLNNFICAQLVDEDNFLADRPFLRALKYLAGGVAQAANEQTSLPIVSLSFVNLKPGIDEAWNFICARYPHKVMG